MNLIFLMDPLELVDAKKDTTYVLICASLKRGHRVFYVPKGGVAIVENKVQFRGNQLAIQKDSIRKNLFEISEETVLTEKMVDAIFIRFDPPFNEHYLMLTWLLDRLPSSILIINSPQGIRTVNEKIWATKFIDLIPKTVITSKKTDFKNFLAKEKNIIVKPANSYGGSSVFKVCSGDTNVNVIFETVTDNGLREVILQTYIPAADSGDKRILLLNGEPLGAVLRVHSNDDHRNNFFSGGKAVETDINDNDLKIIKTIAPELVKLGLYFVGIDIIGNYLIEVNVTSPTCIQEMNLFCGINLENKVIQFVEKLVYGYIIK